MLITANAEQLRTPLTFTPYRGIPGSVALLADGSERVVLVEVPFHLPETIFQNGECVFNSTAHWRPLMNGYSGYTPVTYRECVRSFWDFRDPKAVDAMRAAGATHLMVHPTALRSLRGRDDPGGAGEPAAGAPGRRTAGHHAVSIQMRRPT